MSAPGRARHVEELEELEKLEELTRRIADRVAVGSPARPAPSAAQRPARPPQTAPAPRTTAATSRSPAAPTGAVNPEARPKRFLTFDRVFFVLAAVLLWVGFTTPTERYISPTRGVGYALGIIGGSLMLLLLVYSLRKRWSWLGFLGSTPAWFRFHMVLGILGPLCILYHSNFTTGAANSNVALFAMLTVAGSGFIGRYFYAHVHYGLYGRKLELGDLRSGADSLRGHSGNMSFLPELVGRIEAAERRILDTGPHFALLGFLKPPVVALATVRERWRLHRYLRRALKAGARSSPVLATERRRLTRAARSYIDRRLAATKRVAEFAGYERLFSLWHALHVPLIFMLIIAAVIHVIAVNIY
jgi:hypothetical protein